MIRVQAGVTRKRGLPRFSSAQASCAIDAEVEGAWPQDPDRLSETIRGLYRLCEAAVEEEYASRSVWWVVGTSLGFVGFTLGIGAWYFRRRDF